MSHISVKQRRIDLVRHILIVIFFLALSAVVVGYAAGYRFNSANGRIQVTGAISLSGSLSSATVYLDQSVVGSKLPVYIDGLTPDRYYQVQITKDGYTDWQKTIRVNPARVSLERSIRLFKTIYTPMETKSINADQACHDTIPAGHSPLSLSGGELRDGDVLVTRLATSITSACWFNDSEHIAYISAKSVHIIESDGANDTTVLALTDNALAVAVTDSDQTLTYEDASGKWWKIEL